MELPLKNIKILDLSRQLPGPYCSMILSDLGAEVIHINNPKYPYANPPPFFQKGRYRESAFNSILLRNKKSITLNLKKKEAIDIFYELVKNADIVLESFRPGVMKKLKIDYEILSKINPSIIFCSISGYGQDGPYEKMAGHDLNYVGLCGILDQNKERTKWGEKEKLRTPLVPGLQAGDIGGALVATIGILGAVIERRNNPENIGQKIDISMLDSVFSFIPMTAALHFSKEINDGIKNENILHGEFPFYSIYKTKDNKMLSVGAVEVRFWREVCKGLGREDLIPYQTSRGQEKENTFKELQKEFSKKTQDEWMKIFKNLDACVMPIKNFAEACEDPQILHRKMVTKLEHPKFGKIQNVSSPIKFSRTPLSIRSLAPKMGTHTIEILKELEFTEDKIKEFKRKGVI
jgi:crotonobetainyl-CoA:carnitine CoA-transferase CaiB-like acyl-CoA transferase